MKHKGKQWRGGDCHGYFKINIDAVVFYNEKACGVGVIVINEGEACVLALSKKIMGKTPYLLGETLA